MPAPRARRSRTALVVALCATLGLTVAAAPASAAEGDDPLLPQQWPLSQPALGVPDAWPVSRGAGVVVAVLDTGVQLDHPDLAANLWRNPDEVPGNGVDDDANGVVDDVHGANMLDGSGNPVDGHGHGTHVAGIVAARRGNRVGGAGIAPEARIMAVKVLDDRSAGNFADLAAGIRYAAAEGARIINVSINGRQPGDELPAAVAAARAAGAIVVASAGNDARDLDTDPSYPASLPDENVLSVTAGTPEATPWEHGNRGVRSVDLVAPGQRVISTTIRSGYESRSGTSMAAPYTAGALALLAAARPELTTSALRDVLLQTARSTAAVRGHVAAGHLDVAAAMRVLVPGSAGAARASRRSARSRPALRAARRPRAGRVTLRWSGTATAGVRRWRVTMDRRVVATLRPRHAMRTTARVRRGAHRWGVVGFDARGRRVATASLRFRAVARR